MNASPRLIIRLVLLALVVGVVQLAAVSQITVFGVRADLMPLFVAAVGYLSGSVIGASFGFGTGLLLDLEQLQPLGVTSLLLVAVGYCAGRLREVRDPAHGLAPLAVGAAATALYVVGEAGLQFLLGKTAHVSVDRLIDVVLVVLLNAVLMPAVYALCRRLLLKSLPDEMRRRRRRAYTTGGLSPLSRA